MKKRFSDIVPNILLVAGMRANQLFRWMVISDHFQIVFTFSFQPAGADGNNLQKNFRPHLYFLNIWLSLTVHHQARSSERAENEIISSSMMMISSLYLDLTIL